MKKLFISAAIISMAFSLSAQRTEGGANLVVNGSFGEDGLEQKESCYHEFADWKTIVNLPGWTVIAHDWSGGSEVMCDPVEDAGDGDLRAEDDIHWFRFYSDYDNMWDKEAVQQKMTGLTVGTTYKLEFVFCGAHAPVQDKGWTAEADMNVIIAEVDGDKLGKEVFKQEFKKEVTTDWTAASYEFKATASEMYIKFEFGGWMPADSHDQAWLGLDNVDVYDPNGVNGINDITVEDNAPVEYFNLQGVRVANPESGLYIRRQGAKVAKVVL